MQNSYNLLYLNVHSFKLLKHIFDSANLHRILFSISIDILVWKTFSTPTSCHLNWKCTALKGKKRTIHFPLTFASFPIYICACVAFNELTFIQWWTHTEISISVNKFHFPTSSSSSSSLPPIRPTRQYLVFHLCIFQVCVFKAF